MELSLEPQPETRGAPRSSGRTLFYTKGSRSFTEKAVAPHYDYEERLVVVFSLRHTGYAAVAGTRLARLRFNGGIEGFLGRRSGC